MHPPMAAAHIQHVLLQKCSGPSFDQHENPVLHLITEVYVSMVFCRENLLMQRDLGRRCGVGLERLYRRFASFFLQIVPQGAMGGQPLPSQMTSLPSGVLVTVSQDDGARALDGAAKEPLQLVGQKNLG